MLCEKQPCAMPRHARGLKRPQGSFLGPFLFGFTTDDSKADRREER
jgi:hypothetical protein